MQHNACTEVVRTISTDSLFDSLNSDCGESVYTFQGARIDVRVLWREISIEYRVLEAAFAGICTSASKPRRPLRDFQTTIYELAVIGSVISKNPKGDFEVLLMKLTFEIVTE